MAVKNQKRNDILASARTLFKEKGFHNTKMEEIALNAGVGKGTLYGYFSNKQEIFDETCIERVSMILEVIEEISNKDISFREKLFKMLSLKENELDYEDVSIESIMSNKNIVSEKVVKAMMSYVFDVYTIIIKMVDQGKNEGVVKKGVSSDIIATLIVGAMGEYIRIKSFKRENSIKEEEHIIDLLFNGFGVK
ncbi:TetR/AcrR family transcriptional regulator [Sedimentibacter sp. MB31-C6]|uniref:TetR/AcrR family transcriptional regulator n=1 Tax=Sedimentibacter sp. MB31-C6 TaxID=3109366 RepID=UPI002DDC9DD5|nr:TetR/AcrR family transcriptional regulator [Sedimentibacter sp. MB36-C1]WSI03321.1 TetR/AcrR family transcriptional regulator [Sedimentibacter sp. MB36-C1]